ncbi:helix-turn-helix domain-containing protein [Actinomadura geliboluensis]|uniref:helix-turn-helix domain-containing protein n=1 Tax=Actinomadura geliboluensis TaxID=882440 RepID=UPI003712413C
MDDPAEPQGDLQRLGAELRRLRDHAGISGRKLARRIEGMSQSKVSRIEAGNAVPTPAQVDRWASITGASPSTRRGLVELAEHAQTEIQDYRTALRGRSHRQGVVAEREEKARMVRTFHPSMVPGLLQTAQYALQVFGLSPVTEAREGAPAAAFARVDRQAVLFEPGRRFEFLLTEAALRWRPGPDGRRALPAQLDRIASLSTLGTVSIGIIPGGQEALTLASHAFVIYTGRQPDETFVTIETIHSGLTVRSPEQIELYERTWAALRQMAVYTDEARHLLARLAVDLRASVE